MMPLVFVIHFTSLLLVGPHVTMIVAAAGAAAFVLADTQRTRPLGRTLVNAATIMAAHPGRGPRAPGCSAARSGHFAWPWQAAPIAAAVFTYSIVRSAVGGDRRAAPDGTADQSIVAEHVCSATARITSSAPASRSD